jgi:hypothetical protein
VLITYFDEIKYQPGRQPYYWLAGIGVDSTLLRTMEESVNVLAEEVFGTRAMEKETEFHASDILNGHEHFEGWEWPKRIDVIKRLTTILGATEGLAKFFVRIEPGFMVGDDIERKAFMYFVERVDGYLRAKNQPGILIGDRESEHISGEFAEELSRFRADGTDYEYGRKLTHLIDTVHFTHSHHSRMLQLADLHVWLRQLVQAGDQRRWHRAQIIDHVRSINDCLFAHKYKIWPTAGSRILASPAE